MPLRRSRVKIDILVVPKKSIITRPDQAGHQAVRQRSSTRDTAPLNRKSRAHRKSRQDQADGEGPANGQFVGDRRPGVNGREASQPLGSRARSGVQPYTRAT